VAGVFDTVRYTYRLRPGRIAQAALLAEWDRCRWLWNEAVHQQKTGKKPTFGKLSKMLTEARARFAWLRRGSQNAQQQTLRTYGTALNASFTIKVRGRHRIKRKKTALARKAADAAIGACKTELIQRGKRAGRKVVLVPPAYTTMTCGYTADRDLNAARTILATAECDRASADDVRHQIASFRDGGSDAV
jgi:transposase